nr:hypothetical protein BaRGS_022002 [Batillaria attramentaria]
MSFVMTLTCKVHSFYSDRRLPSPDAVSNAVDLGRISVMAEKVDTVDEFFFVEHHTAGEISKEITDSAGTSQVITTDYLKDHYHDDKGALECRNHTVYLEKYSPSAAALDPAERVATVLGFSYVEHKTGNAHLLIAVRDEENNKTCHVVVVHQSWHLLLPSNVQPIAEQITVTIMSSHEQDFTSITAHDLATRYHDYKGAQECQGHTVYLVDYTPSDDLVG